MCISSHPSPPRRQAGRQAGRQAESLTDKKESKKKTKNDREGGKTHEVEEEVVGVGAEALGEEHGSRLVLVAVAEQVRKDGRHLFLCVFVPWGE